MFKNWVSLNRRDCSIEQLWCNLFSMYCIALKKSPWGGENNLRPIQSFIFLHGRAACAMLLALNQSCQFELNDNLWGAVKQKHIFSFPCLVSSCKIPRLFLFRLFVEQLVSPEFLAALSLLSQTDCCTGRLPPLVICMKWTLWSAAQLLCQALKCQQFLSKKLTGVRRFCPAVWSYSWFTSSIGRLEWFKNLSQ